MLDHKFKISDKICSLDANLEGAWGVAALNRLRWEGAITCSEPMAGIVIEESYGRWSWCKSVPSEEGIYNASLIVAPHKTKDLGVGLSFGLGGSVVRTSSCVDLDKKLFQMPSKLKLKTGRIEKIAVVIGDPEVNLFFVLFAKRDVKMGRNRLWHLRKELQEHVNEPFCTILSYGRSDKIKGSIL